MFVVFMHPIWPSQIFYHWPLFKKCCFYLAFEANSATFPNCTFFWILSPMWIGVIVKENARK